MGYTGSLEKMQITAYSDDSFLKTSQKDEMSVYINPDQYSRTYKICYNDTQAQGSPSGSPVYNKTLSDVVNFQLIFDGTGVVPGILPGVVPYTANGIVDQVNEFLRLVFDYNSKIHSPNYLMLAWGQFSFTCRLSSLKMTYTLFKPDGTPLRAKADTTFVEYHNEKEIVEEANPSSPDLSHLVTVTAGDTLPLLCFNIYGSSAYYIRVAEHNSLVNFQQLIPGMQLLFPPLGDLPA